MPKPSDHLPPRPHIPASDPIERENSWQDAPRLLAALNGARLGAWHWDLASGRVNWSRGAQAIFGLDPNRPVRTQVDYFSLIPEEERDHVLQLFQEAINGSPTTRAFRHRIRWPDGSLHWLEVSGSLQRDEAGQQSIMGVVRDVTEQQEREHALRASEQRFASLFHLSPDVILLVRYEDNVLIAANQHFETLFGWSPADCIGRSVIDLNLWADPASRDQYLLDLTQTVEPVLHDVQLLTRDGRVLDGRLSSQLIELEDQNYILSTFLDLSEHKRREQALRANEDKFAKAFRNTPDAVVITDYPTGEMIEVNPGFEAQFGWSATEALGRTSIELGLWHNIDDRRRMLENLERHG
ncbi:MAG: PAS domain S-box protein, partial [Pseudomonas sp.]